MQGWIVSDPAVLTLLDIADEETIVEVPPRLMTHLVRDGLSGEVTNLVPPIVHVTAKGNYIVKGRRVTDPEVLGQMDIPDHETCVHVTRSEITALLIEG